MQKVRGSRRSVWGLVALVALFLLVVGIAGLFLDEPYPDDRDLQLPAPPAGANDPFREFAENPPRALLSLLPMIEEFPYHRSVELSPDLRLQLKEWAQEFDRTLAEEGGDPGIVNDQSFPEWRQSPRNDAFARSFEFGSLLGAAAIHEGERGDFDQALRYLEIALNIEEWQARFHPTGSLRGIEDVFEATQRLFYSPGFSKRTHRDALRRLLTWEPHPQVRESELRRFYCESKEDLMLYLEDPDREKSSPRTKYRRNLRRFAEVVRHHLRTREIVVPEANHPLLKIWFDPRGDSMVRGTILFLEHKSAEIDQMPHRVLGLRIAAAAYWFELDRGRLPKNLDELVPDYLTEVPSSAPQPQLDHESRAVVIPSNFAGIAVLNEVWADIPPAPENR